MQQTQTLESLQLRPEELFLLRCCRHVACGTLNDTMAVPEDPCLDWSYIDRMTLQHGIAGFMYAALVRIKDTAYAPPEILDSLKRRVIQTSLRNHHLLGEFDSLVTKCTREQVPILPLKGIAFLKTIYAHDTTLRTLGDVDILVEGQDIMRIEKILTERGYQRKSTSAQSAARAYHFKYRRRLARFSIVLEIHRDIDYLDSPSKIDISDCWKRSRAVTGSPGTYYEFSLEDQIIYNCFHILHHISKGPTLTLPLKNFCDIAVLLRKNSEKINWGCIIHRSHDYKVLRSVALALVLVHKLFDVTDIPPVVFEKLQEERFQEDFASHIIKEYIFTSQQPAQKNIPFWIVELAAASTLWKKFRKAKDIPKLFISLYRARYYAQPHQSALRTLAYVIWYYTLKAAKFFLPWVCAPQKAVQVQSHMLRVNRKTQTLLDWLQN